MVDASTGLPRPTGIVQLAVRGYLVADQLKNFKVSVPVRRTCPVQLSRLSRVVLVLLRGELMPHAEWLRRFCSWYKPQIVILPRRIAVS